VKTRIRKILNKKGDVTISYLFIIVAALIVGMLIAWWLISLVTSATSRPILNVRPVPVILASSTPPKLVAVLENIGRADLDENVKIWIIVESTTQGPIETNLNIPAGQTTKFELDLTTVTIPSNVGSVKIVIEYSGGTLEFTATVTRG